MDIRQLEFFLELCKTDSFTRAAKNLYMTTPGLVKSIEKLEAEMGAALFVRTRSGTYMTPAGYELKRYAKSFLQQYQYIRQQVKNAENKRQHSVEVCITWGLMCLFPQNFFSQFIIDNQDIALKVRSYTLEECVDSLVHYRTPVGLLVGDVNHPMLEIIFQREAPMYAILAQDHPLAQRETLRVRDFQGAKLIVINSDGAATARLFDQLRGADITPQIVLDGADWVQTLEMIRSAGFISFCVPPRIHGFEGTVIRPVSDLNMIVNFKMVALKDIPMSDAEKRFIRYTLQRLTRRGGEAGPEQGGYGSAPEGTPQI